MSNDNSLREKIRGACARGYCTMLNEQKILDPVLLEAITDEIISLLPEQLEVKVSEGIAGDFSVCFEDHENYFNTKQEALEFVAKYNLKVINNE